MAQCQDFEGEIVPTSEERKRVFHNDPESGQDSLVILIGNPRQSITSRPDGLSATHKSGFLHGFSATILPALSM